MVQPRTGTDDRTPRVSHGHVLSAFDRGESLDRHGDRRAVQRRDEAVGPVGPGECPGVEVEAVRRSDDGGFVPPFGEHRRKRLGDTSAGVIGVGDEHDAGCTSGFGSVVEVVGEAGGDGFVGSIRPEEADRLESFLRGDERVRHPLAQQHRRVAEFDR